MSRLWPVNMDRPFGSIFRQSHYIPSFLRRYYPFILLIILAVVLRSPAYGDSDVSLDEEFYLVVADRMIHGAIPYVDIWDRKPIGLFLIYAATRLMGGDGFIQYQITAALFAGATAGFIWLIARRSANNLAGILAGLGYLCWLNLFSGSAGQSPVFYNLFVAAAAWLAFRSNDSTCPRHIARLGALAMALCGVTLQIKYTAVAESLFLGLWFLRRIWLTGQRPMMVAAIAIGYGLLGIVPTLGATVWYAAIGHLPEFAYANFWSIFDRGRLSAKFLAHARDFFLIVTIPLQVCLPFAVMCRWQMQRLNGKQEDFILITGWLFAAFIGFVMIGNFYDHYFLPVLPPIFIYIAPLMIRPLTGVPVCIFLIIWGMPGYSSFTYNREKHEKIMELTAAVSPYVQKDCLFIFDGPAVVYMTTQACIPTRFAYPDHLSNEVEKHAIGADTVEEMRRVLATRPGAIITAAAPVIPTMNRDTLPVLRSALMKDYRPVAAIRHPDRIFYVYARNDLAKSKGMRPFLPYADY